MNQRAKRRIALLIGLCIAGVLLVIAAKVLSDWNKQRRVVEARAEGFAAYERDDYEAALNPLSFALANDRNDLELALAFAETRIQNTDDDGKHLVAAENLYKFALTLDAENKTALDALFNIYVLTNQPINALRVAKKLPESDVETHRKRVIAEIRIGEFEDALESIERIRAIDPDDTFWPMREYVIRRNAMEETAVKISQVFEDYVRRFPGNPAVELVLIESMERSGRKAEAIERMKVAARQEKIDAEMVMIMIPMMENLGMVTEARNLRAKTLEISQTNQEVAEQRIKQLWEDANLEGALLEARAADSNFTDTAKFARLSACIAAMNNKSEWSEEEYIEPWIEKSNAISTTAGVGDEKLADAITLFRSNPKESGPLLKQSAALFRNDATIFQLINYMLGKSMESEGDLFGAINVYEQMEARNKTYMSGITLAIAQYRAQDFDSGINGLERVLSKKATVRGMYLYSRMLLEGDEKFIFGLKSKRQNLMRLIERFIDVPGESNVVTASSLLPTFTMIALEEQDSQRVQKALDWMMNTDGIPIDTLFEMARTRAGSESFKEDLLSLIQSRNVDPEEIMLLRLEIEDDMDISIEMYQRVSEALGNVDSSSPMFDPLHVRLLGQLARLELENDFKLREFNRIMNMLPDNVSAARLVATYPDIWSDDPETAEIALQTIVRLTGEDSPTSTTARVMRAINLDEIDYSERAELIIQLDDVIKKSPGSIEALVLMSSLLQKGEQQDLESAANYLRRAIDLKPDLSSLYPRLIDLLKRTGNGSLALEYVNEYKNARIMTLRDSRTKAGVLAREGEYRSAMDELEDLVSKSGENLDVLSLAQFQATREMYEPAMSNFDLILSTEPDNSIAILGKSMVLGAMGRTEEAMTALESMNGVDAGEKLRYMTLVNRVSGNTRAELDSVRKMLEVEPDNVLNILVSAETYQRLEMEEERKGALRRVIELQPNNLEVLTMLANEMVVRQPDAENLDGILRRIERSKPNTARLLRLVRAATDRTSGQLNPTIDQVEDSAELAETLVNMFEAQRVAWLMHTASGDHEGAYKIALRTFISHPTRTEPIYWARQSALQSRMYQEAVDIVEVGMNRISEKDKLTYTLEFSNMCMQLGFESRAYSLLRELQEIADDETQLDEVIAQSRGKGLSPQLVRVTLLRAMLGSSRSQEAGEIFGPLISQDEDLLNSWINAVRHLETKDARNALKIIRPYLEDMQQLILFSEQLSILAERSKDPVDIESLRASLSDLQRLDEKNGGDIETRSRLHIVKSSLRALEGDTEGAIRELENILEMRSMDPKPSDTMKRIECVALNNMALFQCELNPPDTDSALRNVEECLNDPPESLVSSFQETRATVLKLKGECQLAIEAMEEAIRFSRNTEQMIDFRLKLAETLYECGFVERAIAESRVLKEYIYGSPQPDITKLNQLDVLIDKGQSDEE